jgi:E3 ubiquitin-protein ligase RGLG
VVEEEHCAQQQCLPSPSSSAAYSQAPVYPHASAYTQAPVYSRAPPARKLGKRLSRKYSHITDQFTSVEQVQQALSQAGLESSNLIVGIDFTKSNEWTGLKPFFLFTLFDIILELAGQSSGNTSFLLREH